MVNRVRFESRSQHVHLPRHPGLRPAPSCRSSPIATLTPRRAAAADSVHASLIPSACPDDELATHSRRDPYWDRLWAPGSQATWSNRPLLQQRKEAKPSSVNARYLMDENEALRLLTINQGRRERLAAWGAIDSWRTVSAEQLAAITGSRLFLNSASSNLAASISLYLLDVGTYSAPGVSEAALDRNCLYRPCNSETFDKLIAPELTWPEWISVTGGYPWSGGGQYDRHNVLSTELALRAAEYLPIGAVLGEKFSTVDLLAGTGLGKKMKNPDNRRADGPIVRTDGLRIAYELTATASRSLENKVRRWAQLISERPLETSGLTVVFIAAPHPDRPKDRSGDPRHEIYRRVAAVLKEFPGTGADSPAARIGIAAWDEWFPGRHELSEDFFTLSADFALNNVHGPGKWVKRELLGDYRFTPWQTFDATAVVDHAPLLAATPHWMRTGDRTHLIGSPMDRTGATAPVPAPVRPELSRGRPLGKGTGTAGDAKLPPRLRL
ncbi:hypothetical protein [Pseudarthrobacter oxydans]|uniref:hypothetical protein n=1 Tax=Pseudarthrobacter oxydans TaxID=1671 RepID=UPI0036730EE8